MIDIIVEKDENGTPIYARRMCENGVLISTQDGVDNVVTVPEGAYIAIFSSSCSMVVVSKETIEFPPINNSATGEFSCNPSSLNVEDIDTLHIKTDTDGSVGIEFYSIVG